jgi:hypothetical protein
VHPADGKITFIHRIFLPATKIHPVDNIPSERKKVQFFCFTAGKELDLPVFSLKLS